MPELLSEKTVTARKSHRCECCGVVCIQPGDRYVRCAYVYDCRAYTWVSCRECDAINAEVYSWAGQPDEGISADEFQGWAEEHQRDPVHGEPARAYLVRRGCVLDGGGGE